MKEGLTRVASYMAPRKAIKFGLTQQLLFFNPLCIVPLRPVSIMMLSVFFHIPNSTYDVGRDDHTGDPALDQTPPLSTSHYRF
jgi:hypothetical protein